MNDGYGPFCPVRRLRNLRGTMDPGHPSVIVHGANRFNELHRGVPLISRPLLAKRLRDLEKAGVITMAPSRRDADTVIA